MQHAVLALNNAGRPSHWATWEDAVLLKVKGLIAWHLGEDFVFRGGICRATGERSIIRVPSIIAVKNQTQVGRIAFSNKALFARDSHTCCYCGQQYGRAQLTREHIVPTSRGGETSWMNCACACRTCNQLKGASLPEECGMKLLYLPYVPNGAEALILSGRNIKADQMEFLRLALPKNSRLL